MFLYGGRVPPNWKGHADFYCGHRIYETSFLRLARRAWEHANGCMECMGRLS